jgi:hypothetical protein
MTGIKIEYTCVQTDNYQGGSGMVVGGTLCSIVPEDTMIQMIKVFAENKVLKSISKSGYPTESIQINKIEFIEID